MQAKSVEELLTLAEGNLYPCLQISGYYKSRLRIKKSNRWDACEKAGWIYEGIAFDVFNDGKKVYRLFNRATGEHFFTADQVEKDALVSAGWIFEGEALISEGETEVYRLLNPGGMHMFTTSAKERDALVKAGWIYEGIGFKAN